MISFIQSLISKRFIHSTSRHCKDLVVIQQCLNQLSRKLILNNTTNNNTNILCVFLQSWFQKIFCFYQPGRKITCHTTSPFYQRFFLLLLIDLVQIVHYASLINERLYVYKYHLIICISIKSDISIYKCYTCESNDLTIRYQIKLTM